MASEENETPRGVRSRRRLIVVLFGALVFIAAAVLVAPADWRMRARTVVGELARDVLKVVQQDVMAEDPAQCFADLDRMDVAFRRMADFETTEGCGVAAGVRMSRAGAARLADAPLLTCGMARAMAAFEQDVLQPAAVEHLGARVARVRHLGSYNCRPVRRAKRFLSQHAYANALDVSGFVLSDGRTVSVAKDWDANDGKGAFLRSVARAACSRFRVALSPDADALHWNHFHWDLGLFRKCR